MFLYCALHTQTLKYTMNMLITTNVRSFNTDVWQFRSLIKIMVIFPFIRLITWDCMSKKKKKICLYAPLVKAWGLKKYVYAVPNV